jgi:hypothetical protein
MSSLTTYLKDALYNHVLRNTSYTSPTTVYLGLMTDNPTDAGLQTAEVDDHPNYTSGYSRQAIAFDAPSDGSGSNSAEESFGAVVTTGPMTITHVALFDAATAGNMLKYAALTSTKEISNGDIFKYPAGNLTSEFD